MVRSEELHNAVAMVTARLARGREDSEHRLVGRVAEDEGVVAGLTGGTPTHHYGWIARRIAGGLVTDIYASVRLPAL